MKTLEQVLIRLVKIFIYFPYRIYKRGLADFFPIGCVVPPMPKRRPNPKERPKAPTGQNGSREGRSKYRLVASVREGLYHLQKWDRVVEDYCHEKGNIRPEEADQIIKNLERETIYYREGSDNEK